MTDQPIAAWAALLSGIAAVLGAVAWPVVVGWFLCSHRLRVAALLRVLTRKLSTAKKFKFGQLEVEAFEDELYEAVSEGGAEPADASLPRAVPEKQLAAAESLERKVLSAELPRERVLETVRQQVSELASRYEAIRSGMPSGPERTHKMNEVAAGMRTLALAARPLRTQFIASESVGIRLAAICMLQIEPRARYFRWLIERVKVESHAFVLFQASLAILEFVRKNLYKSRAEAYSAIQDAISVVSSFPGGQPDKNTIDVLNTALALLR